MSEFQKPTKPGNAQIVKTGHTFSGQFGSTPMAQTKGRNNKPTPQTFK